MPEIIVLAEAEEELSEAHGHYEGRCVGLGTEFRRAIGEAVERLAEGAAVSIAVPGVEFARTVATVTGIAETDLK